MPPPLPNATALPATSTPEDSLGALLNGAVASMASGGWIRITGEDRVRWLNGMVTNSIQALGPGDGCFNLLLNAQGRIQGTAWAFAEADALLLETDREQVPTLLALLDRFIIMDDVELNDLSTSGEIGLVLAGPGAPAALALLGLDTRTGTHLQTGAWHDHPLRCVSKSGRLFPRWELWTGSAAMPALSAALTEAGVLFSDPILLEHMRLLEGVPRFGIDLRERELPQETGLTEALHFSKGCYVGQEIVERIRSRGNVHRTFHGFRLAGPLPPAGSALEADGRSVGELTSVGLLPALPGYPDGLALALGYTRRETLEAGHAITCLGSLVSPLSLPVTLAAGAHPIPDRG